MSGWGTPTSGRLVLRGTLPRRVFAELPVIRTVAAFCRLSMLRADGSRALQKEGARMFWAVQSDERRVCLLGLEGSLSSNDLVNLTERLRGLAVQGVLRVVVDLRCVSHWDFRGLKCLADGVAYRRSVGAVTAFVSPSRYLRDIASAAGVLDHLDFYDDLSLEAVDHLPLWSGTPEPAETPLRRAIGEGP